MQLIFTILIGALIGWIAGKFMKTSSSFWKNVIYGVLGGFVGGIIGNFLGTGANIILSIIGACLVIYVADKLNLK